MRRTLVWLLCMLLVVSACADEPLFMQGEPHRSQPDFRMYFETMSASAGACVISIKKAAYEPELAQQLYDQITGDEAVLSAIAPVQPHTVYIVDKLPAGQQRIGSAIYCTSEQVLDSSYRPWLAEAAFDAERWQGIGLGGGCLRYRGG